MANNQKIKKYNVIDLFCGIGGFSKGFQMVGFDIKMGIDNWPVALETFKRNHNGVDAVLEDLVELPDSFYERIPYKVDVIIAGPPCQGFSMAGKREVEDIRNKLFREVIRAARILNPEVVIIENVSGILSMKNRDGQLVKDRIISDLESLDYNVKVQLLIASDYGVPQNRKRVIFVATKRDNFRYPTPNGFGITAGDALSNIPDVDQEEYLPPKNEFQKVMSNGFTKIYNHEAMRHNADVLNRIKHVPQGGNWKDIPPHIYNVGGEHSNNYRRLDPDKPSITIKHATKSMIISPYFDRVITAREAARLQSFPDDFILEGTKFEQHQQLANAVPPILGREIAKSVKEYLNEDF